MWNNFDINIKACVISFWYVTEITLDAILFTASEEFWFEFDMFNGSTYAHSLAIKIKSVPFLISKCRCIWDQNTNKIWSILEPILISNSVSQNKIKKLDVILIQFWYQFDIKLHPKLIHVIDIKCSSNLKQIWFISDIYNWSHLGNKIGSKLIRSSYLLWTKTWYQNRIL